MSKIALGTVQFGLNYGINNLRGKIPEKEVFEILDFAYKSGIDTVDTAYAYGDSEKVLGNYFKEKKQYKVITKTPAQSNPNNLLNLFYESLKNLNLEKIYGYIFHDYKTYKEYPDTLKIMQELQNKGIIGKIGFSLYYPQDLEILLNNNIRFDLIQIPYNIFDKRFEKYFNALKKLNIEIHVRSIFLQGLFFKDPESLNDHFKTVKNKLKYLRVISENNNIPINMSLLLFALENTYIDKTVIGVDNLNNLKDNINTNEYKEKFANISNKINEMGVDDESIILPFKWK